MQSTEIFDTIERLRSEGRPFCVATVVRTAAATSAKAGAKAAIAEDGQIHGHVGGACVTRAIREASFSALKHGAPRLIRVKPNANEAGADELGVLDVYRSGCPSGGTADILIEPYFRPPMVAVLGGSPVGFAIVRLAVAMRYRTWHGVLQDETCGPSGSAADTHGNYTLEKADMRSSDFVIVAAQGRRDLEALRSAMESPADFIGMVASGRKAAFLKAKLGKEEVEPSRLSQIRSPVGLDLGGIDPEEIAASIMAEIVSVRRSAQGGARRQGLG